MFNDNAMSYQTFICFCLNEAKHCCSLIHCSWFLDDVECERFTPRESSLPIEDYAKDGGPGVV